jgi:hypothetical protein
MQTLKRIDKNILAESNCGGYSPGTCLTCFHDFVSCEHRKEEEESRKRLSLLIRETVQRDKSQTLQRIAAKFELESDEFFTSEQKAELYI